MNGAQLPSSEDHGGEDLTTPPALHVAEVLDRAKARASSKPRRAGRGPKKLLVQQRCNHIDAACRVAEQMELTPASKLRSK
jgi:hypothetical protein